MGRKSRGKVKEESKEEVTVDFTELPGVGDATAEKLINAGYSSFESLAVVSPAELAAQTGISEALALKIIQAARSKLNIDIETALELFNKRKQVLRITTGSKKLDEILGGGIETQTITEIYGEYGTGKTQFAHQLAVTVQLPLDSGGLDRGCLYIDTEQTFRPERIVQIAKGFGLEPMKVLERIIYARAFDSDHQILITEKSEEYIKKYNIGLIVVDSLISHFRGEYIGRESLAVRQQKLNTYLHKLLKLATAYNLAVLVTNQVMANPAVLFGNPLMPAGGHILGHGVTARLFIRRSRKDRRVIKLVKSPYLPEREVEVIITSEGIRDVE